MIDKHTIFSERRTFSCVEVEKLMGTYVDQEISPVLKVRFDRHMSACHCCRDNYYQYRRVIDVARSLDNTPMPKDVSSRLREVLRERVGHYAGHSKPELTVVKSS